MGKFCEYHAGSLTCLTFQSLPQIQNLFSHSVHSMLGLRLAWWRFNIVWVNFVNVMQGLRLAWLHKVYRKSKIFVLISFTSCWVSVLLGGVSITCEWNFVNVMLGLWLAWLHKAYLRFSFFSSNKWSLNSSFSPQKFCITRDHFKVQCLKLFSPLFFF